MRSINGYSDSVNYLAALCVSSLTEEQMFALGGPTTVNRGLLANNEIEMFSVLFFVIIIAYIAVIFALNFFLQYFA